MRAISLAAFDFDIIKVACVLDDGEASVMLSLKLLVFPGVTLALAVAMLTMRKRGKSTSVDQYLNAIGNVVLITFATLTLTILLPFRCLPNPNGTKAMASIPSLLCWQRRHNIMAALGVAGIIFYPVGVFSVVVWNIWKCPALIAASRSTVLGGTQERTA